MSKKAIPTVIFNKLTKDLKFLRTMGQMRLNNREIEAYQLDENTVRLVLSDFSAVGGRLHVDHRDIKYQEYLDIPEDAYKNTVEFLAAEKLFN